MRRAWRFSRPWVGEVASDDDADDDPLESECHGSSTNSVTFASASIGSLASANSRDVHRAGDSSIDKLEGIGGEIDGCHGTACCGAALAGCAGAGASGPDQVNSSSENPPSALTDSESCGDN